MYTDSNNNFSLRTVILQFLFIALFVFILIWLFPMKKDLKKAISSIETSSNNGNNINNSNSQLSILYDRIFNENLLSMKESAKDYFTLSRVPQNVGDSKKITLQEMLDKKIILPFKDKNGKTCDTKASYVLVTKNDDEFVMKVNLKCGEEENYLLVNMGCYDYCSKTICEKKDAELKVYTTTKTGPTTPKNPVNQPQYRTLYEYKKTTPGSIRYTKWSEWSVFKKDPTSVTEVEVRTEISNKSFYTNWSEWSTKEITGSKTIEVESKLENQTKTTYGAWSNWSTTKVTADSSTQVETKTENQTKTTYGAWSNWSTTKATASSTLQVETKTETKTTSSYGAWSDWSTTKVTADSSTQVETKTEKTRKLVRYDTKVTIDYSKPKYEVKQVPIGSKTVKTCSLYNVTSTVTGFNETYIGMQKFSSLQNSTNLIRYELVGTYNWYCDSECTAGKTFVYKVYQKTPITSTSYSCAKVKEVKTVILGNRTILTGYETKIEKVPVYKDVTTTYYRYRKLTTKTEKVTYYRTRKIITTTEAVKYYRFRKLTTTIETVRYYRYRELITKGEKVTYYRYRTKIIIPSSVVIKWSVYNDTTLIREGYIYTGITKKEIIK